MFVDQRAAQGGIAVSHVCVCHCVVMGPVYQHRQVQIVQGFRLVRVIALIQEPEAGSLDWRFGLVPDCMHELEGCDPVAVNDTRLDQCT